MMRYGTLPLIGALLFVLHGCSTAVPKAGDKKPSYTIVSETAPAWMRPLHTDRPLHDASAFYSLGNPKNAFAARIYLVDRATTSLDVQYYIYEDDRTGAYFSSRLLAAADRGVKVRLLIDDLITSGKDKELTMLAAHPNIEVRLFNPNGYRRFFRYMALLFHVDSLGKRMHNKVLIADGKAAIVGGRNIGDVYFAADNDTFFIDYDVLCIGRVLPDIYTMFDRYWNSEWAVPSYDVLEAKIDEKTLETAARTLEDRVASFRRSEIYHAMTQSDFVRELKRDRLTLTVADAEFYYDDPAKVESDSNDSATHMVNRIRQDVRDVDEELIIVNPYFIPTPKMTDDIRKLREKGVGITVITNSLASTDVFPVYSGYIGHVKPLLDLGVALYEIRPNSFRRIRASRQWHKANRTSLHTKMMIIDQKRLGVGSANLDPRSIKLNTETFMLIRSPKLSRAQRDRLVNELTGDDVYQVLWLPYPYDPLYGFERSGPAWIALEKDGPRIYYTPPQGGFWKTFGMNLLTYLPIEGYL